MIEVEPVPQEQKAQVGILPHGYWVGDRMKDGRVIGTVLALRTHLSAKAASLEQQALTASGETSEVVSPLEYLRKSRLMADTIEDYGTPRSAIIDEGDGYSTWGEIKIATQMAKDRNWIKLIDIAFAPHFGSINMLFNRLKASIPIESRSVEEILRERDVHRFSRDYVRETKHEDGTATKEPFHLDHEHNHTAHLLDRLGKSRYDWVFRNIYEKLVKRPALRLGVDPEKLEQKQRETRKKKMPKKEFPAPIDVYSVNGKRAEAPLVPVLLKINSIFRDIKAKIHPKPEKPKPANMGRIEIFPA
jgi:hypothetical protein